ncbi:FAD-binding oxidoreductase [Egicoccus sp. AB-alg2]|uniref:FAD-binding oxidoreductase n=1 Tax=Egicoccus sp. AB-alg2 TaxID=3242693 RepID=UPI00359E4589
MAATPPTAERGSRLDLLRGLCGGAVHLPGDAGYDRARLPWNLQVDARPAAVAYPAFPDEVATVVRAAAAAGLRVAPMGTGHGAPPLSGRLGDAVLLRTSALTELHVDTDRQTARVGAGVLWGDVVERAGEVGLAARHMSSPSVGVVGSSLGGGISWYARRHGLQCSALTAIEVVLADGSFVRATGHDDLLWAARGGGGFGVVTAVEFDLLPIATAFAGLLAWDWRHAERVLRAWADWTRETPEDVTTVARLFQAPDQPDLPAGLRGRQVVVVDGAVLGPPGRAAQLLAPLRALRPELDTFHVARADSLPRLHLDPEAPTVAHASSVLLDDLPEEAVEALVAAAGPRSGSGLVDLEVRQLGGALARPSPRGGALDRLDGAFLVLGVGIADEPAGLASLRRDTTRIFAALARWASSGLYLPMVDQANDGRRGLSPTAWERLAAIRAAADPEGRFVVPHEGSAAQPADA